jgi:hypothetical protein
MFLQGLNYTFWIDNLVWMYKSNHVNTRFKNGVFSVDSIMSSILTQFQLQQIGKNTMKNDKE